MSMPLCLFSLWEVFVFHYSLPDRQASRDPEGSRNRMKLWKQVNNVKQIFIELFAVAVICCNQSVCHTPTVIRPSVHLVGAWGRAASCHVSFHAAHHLLRAPPPTPGSALSRIPSLIFSFILSFPLLSILPHPSWTRPLESHACDSSSHMETFSLWRWETICWCVFIKIPTILRFG